MSPRIRRDGGVVVPPMARRGSNNIINSNNNSGNHYHNHNKLLPRNHLPSHPHPHPHPYPHLHHRKQRSPAKLVRLPLETKTNMNTRTHTNETCMSATNTASPLTPASRAELASSRMHLVGTQVLRKNSILVSGLLKRRATTSTSTLTSIMQQQTQQTQQEHATQHSQPRESPPRNTSGINSGGGGDISQGFSCINQVQDYFSRYGKISKIIESPRGITTTCASSVSNHSKKDNGMFGDIFMTFMNEKSASLAVRDTDRKVMVLNDGPSGSGRHGYIHARLVYTRYCDEFLNGRMCQDLDCVLLHEIPRNNNGIGSNNAPRSASSPSLGSLRRNAKSAVQKTPLSAGVTPRKTFLAATKGGVSSTTNNTNSQGEGRDDYGSSRSYSGSFSTISTQGASLCSSDRSKLYVTPDSTQHVSTGSNSSISTSTSSCGSKCHSILHHLGKINSRRQARDHIRRLSLDGEDEDMEDCEDDDDDDDGTETGLPAKQLFQTQSFGNIDYGIVSPLSQSESYYSNNRSADTTNYTHMKVHSTPWGFKSPFQLEDDNFDKMWSINRKETRNTTSNENHSDLASAGARREACSIQNLSSMSQEIPNASYRQRRRVSYDASLMSQKAPSSSQTNFLQKNAYQYPYNQLPVPPPPRRPSLYPYNNCAPWIFYNVPHQNSFQYRSHNGNPCHSNFTHNEGMFTYHHNPGRSRHFSAPY